MGRTGQSSRLMAHLLPHLPHPLPPLHPAFSQTATLRPALTPSPLLDQPQWLSPVSSPALLPLPISHPQHTSPYPQHLTELHFSFLDLEKEKEKEREKGKRGEPSSAAEAEGKRPQAGPRAEVSDALWLPCGSGPEAHAGVCGEDDNQRDDSQNF